MVHRIAASIEISPRQALHEPALPNLFPIGTRVYLTDVGTEPVTVVADGARRLQELGYRAVPHLAARRLTTRPALAERLARLTADAGVEEVLVIGGGLQTPAGAFDSSLAVLESGLLDRYGIGHVGIAGHPEGSPDFPERTALEALRRKQAWGECTGARLHIVTQFGFAPRHFVDWADGLAAAGVTLPVHLGVAGPARLTTLVKFAALCGVGNSLQFLKQRAGAVSTLLAGVDPEDLVGPIEQHVRAHPEGAVRQIHVFPFGGLKTAAEWLYRRGSWTA